MENNSPFSKYLQIILILVLAVLGAVYYFYYGGFSYNVGNVQNPTIAFEQNRISAKESYYKDGKIDELITALEKLLQGAVSKNQESVVKTDLAFSYIRKSDFKTGITYFKEIAANAEYPAKQRAYALKAMADIFMLGSRAPGKLSDEIFSGDPYAGFRESKDQPGKTVNILISIKRVYEYASSIYSLPVSEYRIAEWNAKRLIAMKLDKTYKPTETSSQLLEKSNERVKLGNVALAVYEKDEPSDTESAYALWIKGEVLGILSEFENKDANRAEAEDSFKNSIEKLNVSNDANMAYTKSNMLWADFYYAAFLNRAYGKARASDVKDILANIVNIYTDEQNKNLGLFRYLKRIGGIPGGMQAYDYQSALALSKVGNDFARILKDLGWKI